jgi:hypothetical protein
MTVAGDLNVPLEIENCTVTKDILNKIYRKLDPEYR